MCLHATPVAMEPTLRAMAARWPEAQAVNLLDDSLSLDRAAEGDVPISAALFARFEGLGRYGVERMGAAGILATCSAFGPVLDHLDDVLPIPVVKPNAPMFRAAIRAGRNIAMLATFAPAVASMEAEFAAMAGPEARLRSILVEGAGDALRAGDAATHDRLVAEAAAGVAADAVMLAHFSTARALAAVRAATRVPVLAAPEAAVDEMRARLEGVLI